MFIILLWICGSLLSEDSASCCFCQPSASQSTFLSENWKNWTHKYKAGFILSYFYPAPHHNILKWHKRNTFTIQNPWDFSVWKEWQHCLCFINPNSVAMCLSAPEAGTSPVEGVCFVYFCVFYVCGGGRQIDTERRRGGAVFNKWKFHFPGLSSLSQQLVSVSAGPFFFSCQDFLQLYVDQQSELSTDYAYYKTLPFSQVGRHASYLLSLPPVCVLDPVLQDTVN